MPARRSVRRSYSRASRRRPFRWGSDMAPACTCSGCIGEEKGMTTTKVSRRQGLMTALFGTGYVGLRALATGLPAWYLLNPRKATAQDLKCLITAQANMQYLIVSTSSNGDPLNCNCPGTYEATDIIHPDQTQQAMGVDITPTAVTLGSA